MGECEEWRMPLLLASGMRGRDHALEVGVRGDDEVTPL